MRRFTPNDRPIRGDDDPWKKQKDRQIEELQSAYSGDSASASAGTIGASTGIPGPPGATPELFALTVENSPLVNPRTAETEGSATFIVANTGGLLVGNYVYISRTGELDARTSVEGFISSITSNEDGTFSIDVDVFRGESVPVSNGEVIRRNIIYNPDTVGTVGYSTVVNGSISETADGWLNAARDGALDPSLYGPEIYPAVPAKYGVNEQYTFRASAGAGQPFGFSFRGRNPNSFSIKVGVVFNVHRIQDSTGQESTVAGVLFANSTLTAGSSANIQYVGTIPASASGYTTIGISSVLRATSSDDSPLPGYSSFEFTDVLMDIGDLAPTSTPISYFSPNSDPAYSQWEDQPNRSASFLRDFGSLETSWSAWTLRLAGRSGTGGTLSGYSLTPNTYGLGFKNFDVTRVSGERQRFQIAGEVPVVITTYLDAYSGYMYGKMYAGGGSPGITSYVVEVERFEGSGTFASWEIQVIGLPGADGPAGTITSASATSLPPGSAPTVTLGGTPSERTIAFGIPSAGAIPDPPYVQIVTDSSVSGSAASTPIGNAWTSKALVSADIKVNRGNGSSVFSISSGTRINVPQPGLYSLSAYVVYANSSAGNARGIRFLIDGGPLQIGTQAMRYTPIAGGAPVPSAAIIAISSYFEVQGFAGPGGPVNIDSGTISALYIGAIPT